jgi:hypothetical protein
VVVALGNKLRKPQPVTGRLLGARAIGPVFGNHLFAVAEASAEGDQFFRLLLILRRTIFEWSGFDGRAELVAFGHGEGCDVAPLRACEHLEDERAGGVGVGEGLPVFGIQRFRE